MWQNKENAKSRALVPALIGAASCLFFLKSGFLSFFYLVPLGFIAGRYNYKTAWLSFLLAAVGNFLLTLGISGGRISAATLDISYFTVMAFIFTCIIAPPPYLREKVSGPYRLIGGSCLGALVFTFILFRAMATQGFPEYVDYLLDALLSAYRSSGLDVVQSARLEMLNAEIVMEVIKAVMLRGGSFVSCLFMFFICFQISVFIARLFTRMVTSTVNNTKPQGVNSLAFFHVEPHIIWLFSISLFLTVVTRIMGIVILEIVLWNVLVICAILYFAQGLGIVQFFLARFSWPFMRLFAGLLFVLVLFSPFVNLMLLGGLVLLGLIENWMPLRASKNKEPPSTPEAGDGGN